MMMTPSYQTGDLQPGSNAGFATQHRCCRLAAPTPTVCVFKEAAASEAAGQTKEEFSGNDTSRHPKVFKLGPKLGYQ